MVPGRSRRTALLWDPRHSRVWGCGAAWKAQLSPAGPEVGGKKREGLPLLFPNLTTVSPQTHLLPEVGEEDERRERGRRVGRGGEGLPQRVWAGPSRHRAACGRSPPLWWAGPASPTSPSPRQGPVLRLPCSPANSPGFATAFFSFCSFLKLPFKCFLAQMPHASVQC